MTIKAVLLDLDGVVYRGDSPVPGAPEFIRRWRDRGIRFAYITNRSGIKPEDILTKLAAMGVPCDAKDVETSALATAQYIHEVTASAQDLQGSVYAIGGEGLFDALRHQNLPLVDADTEQRPDFVVVGGDPNITYEKLVAAVRFVLAGARFVATNDDRLVNSDTGVVPANGAIVHAIAYATKVQPTVIGKPGRIMIDQVIQRLGLAKDEVILVGDNLETDIEAGRRAGVETVHLLTGVSVASWTKRSYEELDDLLLELNEDIQGDILDE